MGQLTTELRKKLDCRGIKWHKPLIDNKSVTYLGGMVFNRIVVEEYENKFDVDGLDLYQVLKAVVPTKRSKVIQTKDSIITLDCGHYALKNDGYCPKCGNKIVS